MKSIYASEMLHFVTLMKIKIISHLFKIWKHPLMIHFDASLCFYHDGK